MVRLSTLEGDAPISTVPRLAGWWSDFTDVVSEKASDAVSYTSKVFSDAATNAGKTIVNKAAQETVSAQKAVAPLTPYVAKGKETVPTWVVVGGVAVLVYALTAGRKGRRS